MTVRLADPKPAFCSACHNSPTDQRYVDFDAAHDGGAFVGRDTENYVAGSDDLMICEPCLKLAVEVLGLKAELHSRQLREIDRQKLIGSHWKDTAASLEKSLADAIAAGVSELDAPSQPMRRPPGRPRKVTF